MAKRTVDTYTFTPGGGGAGTISFKGYYPLSRVHLITNVTDQAIIFNFADPTKGGADRNPRHPI